MNGEAGGHWAGGICVADKRCSVIIAKTAREAVEKLEDKNHWEIVIERITPVNK